MVPVKGLINQGISDIRRPQKQKQQWHTRRVFPVFVDSRHCDAGAKRHYVRGVSESGLNASSPIVKPLGASLVSPPTTHHHLC